MSVTIWNVQNVGAVTDTYSNYEGTASELLAGFISAILKTYSIDVLVMLEVMKAAEQDLDCRLFPLNKASILRTGATTG